MKRNPARKRGQLMSQPFVYIFALIMGGLILVWGVKITIDFLGMANKAELGKLVKNIESETKSFMNQGEGSTKPITLMLPKSITHFCIADIDNSVPACKIKPKTGTVVNCNNLEDYETLNALVKLAPSTSKKNVFALPFAKAGLNNGKFRIEGIKPTGANPLCFANGAILRLTAKAGYTEAS
ncbi:MAG: hypothetical protein WC852_00620 [Candidatus Nanoarchaeia archaeon]|jgi:hypothetical protein